MPNPLRCALIGADTLLVECGEILRSKGHTITVVAAGSPRVARWAHAQGIPVVDATAPAVQWFGELSRHRFDWLFAITHLALLPDSVLELATRGSVNFHDGPLPEYAGLNTPAWALLNGEREYGISWHAITSGVDTGDLYKQRRFEVAEGETSLSLNTRNFEEAIDSFGELVDELAAGTATVTPQDGSVTQRVYRRIDRPDALAVLDWRQSAATLARMVRALDFGDRYNNPLGFAKLWNGRDAVLVTAAEEEDYELTGHHEEPGTVMTVDDERIVVACSAGQLAITATSTLDGAVCPVSEAVANLGLSTGMRLPVLDDDRRESWTDLGRRVAMVERDHLRELEALEPVELPWAATPPADHLPRILTLDIAVPAEIGARPSAVVAAFGIVLSRLSGKDQFHVALAMPTSGGFEPISPFLAAARALPISIDAAASLADVTDEIERRLSQARSTPPHARELVARTPALARHPELSAGRLLPIAVRLDQVTDALDGSVLELRATANGWDIAVDESIVNAHDAALLCTCLEAVLVQLGAEPATQVQSVDLLGVELRQRVLAEWNDTTAEYPRGRTVHHLFEAQVDATPDATAVVFEDESLSYGELDKRANQVAWALIERGVQPDALVGVHVTRSIDLLVAVLGVHKAGGAYVPLDPTYPAERLEHMIRDSRCGVILTDTVSRVALPLRGDPTIAVIAVDDRAEFDARPASRPAVAVRPDHLAYCIYTSGSTGLPKGVLVEHRNVVNFFAGMDDRVAHDTPATWFAVTSLSFDISVLELLYTLTRGFTVVVYLDRDRADDGSGVAPRSVDETAGAYVEQHAGKPIEFSLFYFSGDEAGSSGPDKYRLLLEGARFADDHGFAAVWTPERHFHAFGGLYPNPAVTGAAVAAITSNVAIRAGSVVLPLHHPIRVAEAWSLVDNLSDGRVGISFASGWQPNDFVLMPDNFKTAKQVMFDGVDTVKRLWRGERLAFDGPLGAPVEVTTLPRPVQPELPVWITSAGNPDTYVQAGKIGANVLTHLLGQSVEQLAEKIALYRTARAEAGYDPQAGVVSLMLHTFVGDDEDAVRDAVREPLKQYLGTSFSLLKDYAWAFPAFQRPGGESGPQSLDDDDFKNLSPDDLDAVLEFAYLRYYESSGLFGTAERCRVTIDRLKGIGVDEIACLVDFGVDTDSVLASLPYLDGIRRTANQPGSFPVAERTTPGDSVDQSVAAQLRRHHVSHLQCTPSMARMFLLQDDTRAALADVDHLFVGGEAFPLALANDLRATSKSGRITNMYGPTETTIWSTTWPLDGDLDTIPIGTPVANTQIYILDKHRQPLPPGVAGDLWIGGDGVVRGYHERPELTAERFVADPFRSSGNADGHRMYFTGDLARWRQGADGSAYVEFLGRIDHQVKVRGYRIELGEIEAQLGTYPGVVECVAVVQERSGHIEAGDDQQLVAYVSTTPDAIVDPAAVKARLRQHLPDVMVPAHIVLLDELPHTPNGKIDRNALPSLADATSSGKRATALAPASNDVERDVLAAWEQTLGTDGIGVDDNFFDIGGHSLLVVRMHRLLNEVLGRDIALTDLYRYPTVRTFAESLSSDGGVAVVQTGQDRAARRLQRRARR